MKLSALCCVLFGTAVAAVPVASDISPIRHYDNVVLFKNYAFSQCIGRAYKAAETRRDALSVADAYVQFGDVSDVDAYGAAVALAEKWLKKRYESKSNEPLQLMKCIDFMHSRDLDELAKRHVPTKNDSSK